MPAVPLPAVAAGAPVRAGTIPEGTMLCYADESRTTVRPMRVADEARKMVGCMRRNKVRFFTEGQLKMVWDDAKGIAGEPQFFYWRVPLRRLDEGIGEAT